MENFVVSARKYRPATFDTVVGQSHITTTLKNAIRSGQLAQAFLFCGPRGVGKTTCARILAKTINCTNLTAETEACDVCESCRSYNTNASFNVHELDAASNNSVDDIRNLVEQVRYPPHSGKYKVYIIDEVHMLSNSAFNAFLKTLEEPPHYAIFILATTEKHKIIPTILSRCQIFDFNRIQPVDIANHLAEIALKENVEANGDALQLIARKADGGLRDALSMFDMLVTFSIDRHLTYQNVLDNLHILDYDYYFKITDALLNQNAGLALVIFDEILKKGFDGHNFIAGLSEHFRNLMICRDPQTVKLLEVSENVQKKYIQQAQNANLSFILTALNIGSQCDLHYKQSKNQKLLVELSLVKMAHLLSAIQLVQENRMPEAEKKKPEIKETKENISLKEEILIADIPEQKPVTAVKANNMKTTVKLSTNLADLEKTINHSLVEESEEVIIKKLDIEDQHFDKIDIEKYFIEMNDFLEKNNRLNDALILKKPFEIVDNDIIITLDSNTQLQKFQQDFKAELTEFLRNKINNFSLNITTKVSDVEESKRMIYTVEEKFKYLLEKYPELNAFKKQLNLEI